MPPSYALLSQMLNEKFTSEGEWCGVPMPLPDLRLTLADGYPLAKVIDVFQSIIKDDDEESISRVCHADDEDWQVVNTWYSRSQQRDIAVITNGVKFEALRMGKLDYIRRVDLAMNTFKAHLAWSLDTEAKAIEKLATLIKPHLFQAYMVTGMFMETSKRSKLAYLFRRQRPTIVLSWTADQQVLCTLCLHPIGYYAESFAGSMCPTDEVIAHLLLMRGDEHMYWKRANQHQPWHPEAGL